MCKAIREFCTQNTPNPVTYNKLIFGSCKIVYWLFVNNLNRNCTWTETYWTQYSNLARSPELYGYTYKAKMEQGKLIHYFKKNIQQKPSPTQFFSLQSYFPLSPTPHMSLNPLFTISNLTYLSNPTCLYPSLFIYIHPHLSLQPHFLVTRTREHQEWMRYQPYYTRMHQNYLTKS